MKMRNSLWLSMVMCFLCFSCKETRLEQAFRLAGDNRSELEHVIEHYSKNEKDSLKLKAAIFLIENMPGHFTKYNMLLKACREMPVPYLKRRAMDICCGVFSGGRIDSIQEDIKIISSDFLIQHIDRSFKLLEYPWCKNLPFEWFLEYILPYRIENEELGLFRDSICLDPNSIRGEQCMDDRKYDASRVNLKFQGINDFSLSNEYKQLIGGDIGTDCHYMYLAETFWGRAEGLPMVLDYIPYYPKRNGSHHWCHVLSAVRNNSVMKDAADFYAAKVYRRTFSHNFFLSPGQDEEIPDFFRDPFNKDVTDTYFRTADVTVSATQKIPNTIRYAYLCVFNDLSWRPIAIGERLSDDKFLFEKMGKDILYLPVWYDGVQLHSIDYPFVLKQNNQIERIIPDTTKFIAIQLYRKYPYNARIEFSHFFGNVIVEASNREDFAEKDTISIWELNYGDILIDKKIKHESCYRYLKIIPPMGRCIADLYFWNQDGDEIKPISVDTSLNCCLDHNPLTALEYNPPYILLDFGESVEFSRTVCLPRNDGKGIYPNNMYELFYYDFNEWKTLGQKRANDFWIDFLNVPSGGLYWLRDLSGGREERIFTYSDGEVRWW